MSQIWPTCLRRGSLSSGTGCVAQVFSRTDRNVCRSFGG